ARTLLMHRSKENTMSSGRWVDSIERFARHRAKQFSQASVPGWRRAPDYDVPAFIRRGIRRAGLEAFHRASRSSPAPPPASADCRGGRHRVNTRRAPKIEAGTAVVKT